MHSTAENKNKFAWDGPALWLAFTALVVAGLRTISHSDFWMHLAAGRWMHLNHSLPGQDPFSYSRADSTWTNISWLYDRLIYLCWQSGGTGTVIILHVLAVTAAFILLALVARKWCGPLAAGTALLLCTWILLPGFDVRPRVFCLLFAAVFIYTLHTARRTWIPFAVLIPVQILWANMSGSFILGLLIVAAFLVQSVAAKNPAAAGAVRYGLVLAAVALAAVINPLHLKIYGVVVDLWRNPAFMYFQSWGAPFAYLFPPVLSRHISTLSLVIGALGLIFYRDRLPLAVTIMAVLGALLAVYSHARLSDIFALLAFPFFCLSVSAIGNFIFNALKQKPGLTATQQHKLAAALVIVLSACTLWLLVSNRYYSRHGQACGFGLGAEYDMIPEAAASVIEEHTDATRIFNLPPDGGYLAWRLPGRQIHTDNRAGLYGVDFFRDLLAQFYNGNSAVQHQYLQQWDPDLLVLNTVRPLGEQTVRNIARAGWNPVFIDGTTTVLTQQDPLPPWSESARQAGQNLLDRDFQSYRQDIGGLIKQPLPARLIGAGSTFMALKRYREAAALYAALTRAQPEMAGAWRNLGVCLLEINDPGEAVRTLEKATDLSPRDAIAWFWLSRACKALGADRDAANAWETACRLDPSLPAALQQETAQ